MKEGKILIIDSYCVGVGWGWDEESSKRSGSGLSLKSFLLGQGGKDPVGG